MFHVGGPCESDTALCLAIAPAAVADEDSPLRRVAGDVYLVDLDADPADLPEQLTGLRVFAGYAGWSPGQLAGEIAEGAWACVPRPAGRRAQRRRPVRSCGGPSWAGRPGRLAVLSTAPADPTAN